MTENSLDFRKSRRTERGHILIHILVALFGVSAWIGINGIFVQLPVLIGIAPEGWKLPVYVVLVIQSANVGPVFYTVLQQLRYQLKPSSWILSLLITGSLAMLLLVFFYPKTIVIGGDEHSLALFVLIFINALVGCSSSVLFMPYLYNFNKIYMVSYFIGEGLSGVLPSIVALFQGIQDAGQCENATSETNSSSSGLNFEPSDYFIFLSVILLFSLMAFILLEHSPFVQERKNFQCIIETLGETEFNESPGKSDICNNTLYRESIGQSSSNKQNIADHTFKKDISKQISKGTRIFLFFILCVACFFGNGFLPSIQSYSCLPYGRLAYKLSITLSQIANPLACFFGLWALTSNIRIINYLLVISLLIGTYVTYLALQSPSPPLQEQEVGIILVVLAWAVLTGCISYLKLIIVATFRNTATQKILFNVGAVMQAGSATGAIASFLLINFTNTFTVFQNCAAADN